MPSIGVDFTVSNNEDWKRSFSITDGIEGVRPWANVPAWSAATAYEAGASVVQYGSDLFVAKPNAPPTQGAWKPIEWVKVGAAVLFAAKPLDLTGVSLSMGVAALTNDGTVADRDAASLQGNSTDGKVRVVNALGGGIRIAIPASEARAIKAGTYAYDIVATWPDKSVRRIIHGTITVQEGISR